jgi:hypothetical protein
VFVDADHPYPDQARRTGLAQQPRGGLDGDAVHGVPGAAELARHGGHRGLIDDEPTQHELRAAPGGRGAGAGQAAGVVDEDLPLAAVMAAAVARDSDPQLERMTHDRDVGDPTLNAVSVDPRDPDTDSHQQ